MLKKDMQKEIDWLKCRLDDGLEEILRIREELRDIKKALKASEESATAAINSVETLSKKVTFYKKRLHIEIEATSELLSGGRYHV